MGVFVFIMVASERSRKMTPHAHKYYDILINDDPMLEESINNIKNADNYEEVGEKEDDEDKDGEINMNAEASIE